MKKILTLLLLIIFVPISQSRAQGLHGKILVLRNSREHADYRIEPVLASCYNGKIDTASRVPDNLSGYDAILVALTMSGDFADSLSVNDQLNIISYIANGGQFYAESDRFFLPADSLLWHYLGLKAESQDGVYAYFDIVRGVDSEFTVGIGISQGFQTAYEPNTYFLYGDIFPVLFGKESSGENDIIAWIPSNLSLRAVMHHTVTANYYSVFLRRVLCNYFGLCSPDIVEPTPMPTMGYLQVVIGDDRTSIRLVGEESANLDVINLLGITVFHSHLSMNKPQIELPNTLPGGVYFARARTAAGTVVKAFVLLQK